MWHSVTAIKNRSLFLSHFFSFRDNWTSLLTNGFPVLNFANFRFTTQSQILIYIFFKVVQCDCNQIQKSLFTSRF